MDMKMVGAIPEFRYWFGGRPMMREFIGVAALGTSYDITWGSETYKGDAWGGGLTFGYAFFLSPHWNIECYGSVGAVYYDHKHYYRDDHYSENRARLRLHPVQTRRFLRLYHQVNPQLAYHHV